MKYANMELKRLKKKKNPLVSRSCVFTPANAGAAEEFKDLVESAKQLEKEIKKCLNTNSTA